MPSGSWGNFEWTPVRDAYQPPGRPRRDRSRNKAQRTARRRGRR